MFVTVSAALTHLHSPQAPVSLNYELSDSKGLIKELKLTCAIATCLFTVLISSVWDVHLKFRRDCHLGILRTGWCTI